MLGLRDDVYNYNDEDPNAHMAKRDRREATHHCLKVADRGQCLRV